MTFTSYAQNFEDVMLWRALKHIRDGRYIDVGAQDPVVDSVSKAFYERGWRGIHFEPVPQYANLLRADRPDEAVLEVAASDRNGSLILNVIADTGLSTAVDAHAATHTQAGFQGVQIAVAQLTLAEALRGLFQGEVHWMKVDVEGFEAQVLTGWDSNVLRPWIIVVEATKPLTSEADHATWEPLLIGAGYSFVYFDGLNRFYVAQEHPELVPSFSSPPNVFDAVRLSGLASSELCKGLLERHASRESSLLEQLSNAEAARQQTTLLYERATSISKETGLQLDVAEHRANELNRRVSEQEVLLYEAERARISGDALLASAEKRLGETNLRLAEVEYLRGQADLRVQQAQTQITTNEHQIAELSHRIQALLASRSWQLTAPLRGIGTGLRKVNNNLLTKSLASAVRQSAKRVLNSAFDFADANPKFRTFVGKVAHRTHVYQTFLGLYVRLKGQPAVPQNVSSQRVRSTQIQAIPPEPRLRARATAILAELEAKISLDKSEIIK